MELERYHQIKDELETAAELFHTISNASCDEYGEAMGWLAEFIERYDLDAHSEEFTEALYKEVQSQVQHFNENAKIVTETKKVTRNETETRIEWNDE